MTQSQINYFLAVAKEKSISKASEALFVSQPAVSKQIALLETELGCKLFERHTRGLNLTSAGKEFENLFLEFQLRFKEILDSVHAAGSVFSGSFNLGALDGWLLSEFCLDMFQILQNKYPMVEFEVTTYTIDQIVYALKRGEANAIIATESLLKDHSDLTIDQLTTVKTLLLYSARHPLAKKDNLTLSDFADATFYVTSPQNQSSGISNLMSMCDDAGFAPKIEHLTSISSVYNKIQAGKGVFITNEWIMAKTNPVFKTLPLPYEVNVAFATLKDNASTLSTVVGSDIVSYFKTDKQ